MARKYRTEKSSGMVILLVDDSQEYCDVTRMVLEHEGHNVLVAYCGKDAIKILSEKMIDLILLDYFMPGMTGEEVVAEVRKFNPTVQIILQTGYASENPSRDLLKRLNIQGYHDKSEGTEKLLLWVEVGLKAACTVKLLNKSRMGLNYILEVTPEMHKIQPLDELLQGILWQFSGLLGFDDTFLAVISNEKPSYTSETIHQSFLAMVKDDLALRIHAGIGKYKGKTLLNDILDPAQVEKVNQALLEGKVNYSEKSTIIPLLIGDQKIGVIYLDENIFSENDIEILSVFASQASVAIQNALLYEMATRDQLTGVNVRRYALQLLTKEIKSAFFTKTPMTIILFDLDNLKKINDSAGHTAGDRALTLIGSILKKATRSNDLVGRYGGDEFTIVLPQTDETGAVHVAERIIEMMRKEKVYAPGQVYPITGSLGIVTLSAFDKELPDLQNPIPLTYFRAMLQVLIRKADEALYTAKKNGRARFECNETVHWLTYGEAIELYDTNT